MQIAQSNPWYKQFWPWFLIAIPVSSFIVGGTLLHFAINTSDSLVVDDYYKEGRAINARLDKIEYARYLNITTEMQVSDYGEVRVEFHSGRPTDGQALQLNLYHVTLADKDQKILLSRDAGGVYRGRLDEIPKGKWQVTLLPMDAQWKVQQTVWFPQAEAFKFNP